MSVFVVLLHPPERNTSGQRCVLGSEEGKLGSAAAAAQQRANGCRLQRQCMDAACPGCSAACFTHNSPVVGTRRASSITCVKHVCLCLCYCHEQIIRTKMRLKWHKTIKSNVGFPSCSIILHFRQFFSSDLGTMCGNFVFLCPFCILLYKPLLNQANPLRSRISIPVEAFTSRFIYVTFLIRDSFFSCTFLLHFAHSHHATVVCSFDNVFKF